MSSICSGCLQEEMGRGWGGRGGLRGDWKHVFWRRKTGRRTGGGKGAEEARGGEDFILRSPGALPHPTPLKVGCQADRPLQKAPGHMSVGGVTGETKGPTPPLQVEAPKSP